ncbi:MAG: NAD-dependent epimerase/dehydratase family protein [Gemmatimonadaceae bacterium]
MSRRVLITGGAGFAGQWMCRALLARGWSVYAGSRSGAPASLVLTEEEIRAVCWTNLDVTSDAMIERAVQSCAPDYVVHLAGMAFAPEADAAPVRAFEVNALAALRLLEALKGSPRVRVLIIGSAFQYGAHDSTAYPIREDAPQRPLMAYGVAKAAQELIALHAFRSAGTQVVCTRSFNHSGVGHDPAKYLLPGWAARLPEVRASGGKFPIGNPTVVRDYLHVADVADAYALLLERGVAGEAYNVSSGVGTTIRELAERFLGRAGIAAEIIVNPAHARPLDVPILVGDNTKLRQATGWAPKRSIDDIIDDLIHAAAR